MVEPPLFGREPFLHRDDFTEQSVEVWKSDKRLADQKLFGVGPDQWSYKNKIYDLSQFIKRHPGGEHWLEMTKGSDITDFVETHHLNLRNIEEILQKYYVKDCHKKPEFARFDWSEKGLFYDLRERIVKKLNGKSTSASFYIKMQYSCLILLFLSSFYLLYLTQSRIMAIITGFLCLSMLGIGHNFTHQKPSLFRFCADLTMFGSYQWTISHALSHHTYTNLEIDIEVQAMEPIIYYLANKPKNQVINIILGHLLFLFMGILNFLRRFIFHFMGKDKLRIENAIPMIELLILWSNAVSLSSALYLWTIMHGVASIHLMLSTFPNHRTDNHWSEGDPKPVKGFAEHTIITTSDHSVKMNLMLAYICFGGFNDHILHHMFPTIDRGVLPEFKGTLIESCKEFGIVYQESDFWKNFVGVYRGFFREKPYYVKKQL